MHSVRILYTLKSHLLIDSGQGDENMMVTREYLPGTTLIGAFATRYIGLCGLEKSRAHLDSDFRRFFLGHDLHFLCAYLGAGDATSRWRRSVPIPACLFEIKKEAPKGRGPKTLHNRLNTDPEPGEAGASGWCVFDGNRGTRLSPKKRIHFHHQQEEDRFTGRSTGGMIFNYDTLFPGQSFVGEIRGSAGALKDFRNRFQDVAELPIGRSKMTEYGRVGVRFLDKAPQPVPPPPKTGKGASIVATCLSPVILYNENGFPDPSARGLAAELASQLSIEPGAVEIIQYSSGVEHVENYVGIWNMRKFTDMALCAGTVFKMNLPPSVTDADLHALQCGGIGLRRSEGFGEIRLGFPAEKTYAIVPVADREPLSSPPGGDVPPVIQALVTGTLRDHLKEQIRHKAQDDSLRFRLDNTAILGRLEQILSKGAGRFAGKIKAAFVEQDGKRDKKAASTLKFCYTRDNKRTLWQHVTSPPRLADFIREKGGADQKGQGAGRGLHALMADPVYRDLNIEGIMASLDTDEEMLRDYWLIFIRSLRKQHSEEE